MQDTPEEGKYNSAVRLVSSEIPPVIRTASGKLLFALDLKRKFS